MLHCSTLYHTVSQCNTLCYTVTQCNTVCYTVTQCNTLCYTVAHCNSVTHCYIAQCDYRQITISLHKSACFQVKRCNSAMQWSHLVVRNVMHELPVNFKKNIFFCHMPACMQFVSRERHALYMMQINLNMNILILLYHILN